MAHKDKLMELLLQTINNLENAMQAKIEENSIRFSEKIWKVAADLEYFTFIVKLSIRKEDSDIWIENLKTARTMNIDDELLTAQKLLREAASALATSLEESYRKAWSAQEHILRVQGKLERTMTKQNRPQP